MGQVNIKPAAELAVESQEATRQQLINAIQTHLDDTAKERGYDGILSLASYATDPEPKFKAEGQAGVEWRGKVWAKGYAMLAEVQAGTRPVPTEAELLSEMPAIVWPN